MVEKFSFEMHFDADMIAREVPSQRILELVVSPPAAAASKNRPPLNLALVIDRSGSMSGEKLGYVKQAAEHVLDLLQAVDRVTIVAYDTKVTLVSPSMLVTPAARTSLKAGIQSLTSGDMTNLSGGWLKGCQEVAAVAQEGGLNRVLLLTDGLANHGITDLEELGMHAGQLLVRGVATSTFGVGQGFNEHLLEHMANQGGGRFYYIDKPQSIPQIFEKEFNELAAITARNVKILLEIAEGVSSQVLGSWRVDKDGDRMHIWLGDLAAGARREVYVKLLTPPAGDRQQLAFTAHAMGQGEKEEQFIEDCEAILVYAPQSQAEAAPVRMEVMQRYSMVEIADRATEALKLERAGEKEKASKLMERSVQMAAPYIPQDVALEYNKLSDHMRHGMDESTRKDSHQQQYMRKQGRDK
jgi:Ca-activated chloride channel family protein